MEEITMLQAYLVDFNIFYVDLRLASWPILVKGMGIFVIFSILRIIVKYATASPIGNMENGSYLIRSIEYIMYMTKTPEEQKTYKHYDKNHKYIGIKGGHLGGAALDLASMGIILSILIWIWPLVAVIAILFGPIQVCRNHFMKKKKFIANLKGEELDI